MTSESRVWLAAEMYIDAEYPPTSIGDEGSGLVGTDSSSLKQIRVPLMQKEFSGLKRRVTPHKDRQEKS
jgi:hypothetical protein